MPRLRRSRSPHRRTVTVLLVLVVAGTLLTSSLSGALGLGGSAAEAGPECRPFAFIGVRGSGETAGLGGPVGDVSRRYDDLTRGRANAASTTALSYPAVAVEEVIGSGTGETYRSAVVDGVTALRAEVDRLVYACPGTRFLLVGYSQGAHVISQFLEGLDSRGRFDGAVVERIAGIALFGSPRFTPGDGPVIDQSVVGRNAYDRVRRGLFWPQGKVRSPSILSATPYRSISRSYCLGGDIICQTPGPGAAERLDRKTSPHYHYTDRSTEDAARWLSTRSRLAALRPAPAPVLAIGTTSLPQATVGTAYDTSIAVTGGRAPYRWTARGLPPGLTFRDGRITGTPTEAGRFPVTVTARDRGGAVVTGELRLEVAATGALPPSLTRITVRDSPPSSGADSYASGISDDGRWGAFQTRATAYGSPGCLNNCGVAVVVNLTTDETTTIPRSVGVYQDGVTISADGSTVAYGSSDVLQYRDGAAGLNLYDRAGGAITTLTRADGGMISIGSQGLRLSRDGRFLLFDSTDDVLGDQPGGPTRQLWRYDRTERTYQRVSVGEDGAPLTGSLHPHWLSPDGQQAAFSVDGRELIRDIAGGRTVPGEEGGTLGPRSPNGRWDASTYGSTLLVRDISTGARSEIAVPAQIRVGDCFETSTLVSDDGNRFLIQTCGERTASSGERAGALWWFDRRSGRTELVDPLGYLNRGVYRHVATPDLSRVLLTGRDVPGDVTDTNEVLDVYRWSSP